MLGSPVTTVAKYPPHRSVAETSRNGFVHPTAVVGKGVKIGKHVRIGAFAVIDEEAELGDDVEIGAHVSIGPLARIGTATVVHPHVAVREHVRIGRNVVINSGTVIGSDGFGFRNGSGVNHKIPQLGIVEIEDDVWIGSNVTIDRATVGATRIRRGARIDNLVQIGHNVEVGENTVVRPQVGIAGSTTIGADSYIGQQVGIINHIAIGRNVTIHPLSGITKGVTDGEHVMGAPAKPIELEKSLQELLGELPCIMKEFQDLRRRLGA
ncbi:MAG: UDP-3-O-(3-hydroxymyristoyl)glucosamine N-acyltransferase [Candidatus Abyssobacteria bacterium SURF_17]|jgi:UDP-3-O-[3-hydroxymyristoyl] glucosamine N-acyltransferase|uniref:UDP-3-O-(3-hydroxymyristoyl)glucosamine N-acyltransferase n=1 Tax=Candidatus Abyssobacteria bacterium SURF_17 TaxID=2093361 RepID=A0A419EZH5_9BACT|nr:MAG: UDP-3-O-(3-hydroxymyristoyl)glucosamine N-acyltransferase [Candidatus Abyssubacteria bacterium SURF_17]